MAPAARPSAQRARLYTLDPTTTLYTFMLKTDPSINTVHLLGSWDNFAMTYAMERDSRRERGQWRGCHTFNNIICDGDSSTATNTANAPRNGGLKMGHTYYYYYELDGTTETHDPTRPSTTTCPYLPGQSVNTLWVPEEKPSRDHTGSVSSVDYCDFKTMNPADRFVNPRPPTAMAPHNHPHQQHRAALPVSHPRPQSPVPAPVHHQHRLLLRHQRSAQSLASVRSASSGATWSPRRLFNRKASPCRDGSSTKAEEHAIDDFHQQLQAPPLPLPSRLRAIASSSSLSMYRRRDIAPSLRSFSSAASSQGTRSRDISPDSLRRFLVDDTPLEGISAAAAPAVEEDDKTVEVRKALEADEEEDDDEHNFASSAVSESAPFTVLSPPPPPRSATLTPPQEDQMKTSMSDRTIVPSDVVAEPTRIPPAVPAPIAVRPMAFPLALRTATLPPPSSGLRAPSPLPPLSPLSPPASPLSFLSPGLLPDGSQLSSSFSDSEDEDDDDFYDSQNHDEDDGANDHESPVALVLPASELGGFPSSNYSSGDFASEFSSEFHDCLEFQQPDFNDCCSSLTSKSSRSLSLTQSRTQSRAQSRAQSLNANKGRARSQSNKTHSRSHSKPASISATMGYLPAAAAAAAVGRRNTPGLEDLVDELGWMATAIEN